MVNDVPKFLRARRESPSNIYDYDYSHKCGLLLKNIHSPILFCLLSSGNHSIVKYVDYIIQKMFKTYKYQGLLKAALNTKHSISLEMTLKDSKLLIKNM